MRYLTLIILLLIGNIGIAAEFSGVVVNVRDGDTVEVLDDLDKVVFRVRFFDTDAPEDGQAFGKESKAFLEKLCLKKSVTVRFIKVDAFRRLAGTVYYKGEDLGLLSVKAGLSWHYREFSKKQQYAKAEQYARDNHLGVWSDDSPLPPWKWRKENYKRPKK